MKHDIRAPALFFAPFVSSAMRVEPQWIDYNGHLNMAYYHVLFDRAVDEVFSLVGLTRDYVDSRQASTFTAECHILYKRELTESDQVRVTAQLIAFADLAMYGSKQAGRSRFNLPVLPAGDFPVMSSDGLSGRIAVDTNELMRLIDKTRFAISTEETRYYLNGIFFHVADEGQPVLKAAATDGHRLARVTMPRPEGAAGMPDIIVPRKCVAEIRKLLDEGPAGDNVGALLRGIER